LVDEDQLAVVRRQYFKLRVAHGEWGPVNGKRGACLDRENGRSLVCVDAGSSSGPKYLSRKRTARTPKKWNRSDS
ncbi:hypothetical protein, partial [Burkholderia cenocepacia]|uniref:hypothetical protein n=4 Tax=Burkholderia cenocepacia TaxID=95486 RepID=UPI0019554731